LWPLFSTELQGQCALAKLKHWRGFAAIMAPEAAPVLEFDREVLLCLAVSRHHAPARCYRRISSRSAVDMSVRPLLTVVCN